LFVGKASGLVRLVEEALRVSVHYAFKRLEFWRGPAADGSGRLGAGYALRCESSFLLHARVEYESAWGLKPSSAAVPLAEAFATPAPHGQGAASSTAAPSSAAPSSSSSASAASAREVVREVCFWCKKRKAVAQLAVCGLCGETVCYQTCFDEFHRVPHFPADDQYAEFVAALNGPSTGASAQDASTKRAKQVPVPGAVQWRFV
jgi:hypothetical protein